MASFCDDDDDDEYLVAIRARKSGCQEFNYLVIWLFGTL
jgi:hypothetical protein